MQQVVIVADPEEVDDIFDMLRDMAEAYANRGGNLDAFVVAASQFVDETIEAGEPVAIH